MAPMRGPLAVTVLALLATGCATPRTLPRHALAVRSQEMRDPPATGRDQAVLAFATAQVGRPYCWGGRGPACFDCSGLVQSAWRWAGVSLPRTSGAMGAAMSDVPLSEVRPGDVLWWPGHVALYAGAGLEIEALDQRHGVVVRPVASPYRALRPD